MSAMRAEELPELPDLPEVPSVSPQDSAVTRAAVRWTAPLDAPEAAPAPALDPDAPHDQPAQPSQPAQPPQSTQPSQPTPRPQPPRATRPETANPPLRLTRRGRVVVGIAAALVLAGLSLVIASAAQAAGHPGPACAARQGLVQVTVHPGQSLWSVAESADPGADTRVVVQQIVDLNDLTGNVVFAGQRLWAPRA